MTAILKSLTLAARPVARDAATYRRANLVERLEEQKQLAIDPNYIRTVKRWIGRGDDRRLVEKQQQARPWWRANGDGSLIISVFYGTKPIEFEKGKSAIAVASKEKLLAVIEALIEAVRSGELDEHMARLSKQVGPKTKKAG